MATAAMTCSKSTRAARSKDRALTTTLVCHRISTSFHLDRKEPNLLHDEITVFDHALTRPWSVDKTFRRDPSARPSRPEPSCVEGNANIVVGTENHFLIADGFLMPAKKDQPPPDLRYFKRAPK